MVAFLYRMPSGIQGDISRRQSTTVESLPKNSALPFPTYGVVGKVVSGKFIPLVATDTAAVVYGVLARPFPTQGANASDPLGTSVPAISGIADVMRRGYMTVVNNFGTPAVGGPVYVRNVATSGARVLGGFEAGTDANNFVLPGVVWTSTADASGNAEIGYNI